MDPKTITLSALLVASAAGNVYVLNGAVYEKKSVISEAPSGTLAAATPECQALVTAGGFDACEKCTGYRWDGQKRLAVDGWCCSSARGPALMPADVQTCLDKVVLPKGK